jgi:pSer/pThr/pTyr-binding forkhead associated (FHA) protein
VPVNGRFTIGRDETNDLSLADAEVSRNHAVIEPTTGGWQIQDLDSTNGTWLNNSRIRGSAPLKVGDILRLGKTSLQLKAKY